jgi:hypothetical protein
MRAAVGDPIDHLNFPDTGSHGGGDWGELQGLFRGLWHQGHPTPQQH